jgi:hypothetical protein
MRKGPLTSTKPLATKPKPTVTKPGPTSTTVKKPVARVPLYQNGVKPKYEAFSDLLHPSERFGTKIEDMEYTRSKVNYLIKTYSQCLITILEFGRVK